MEKCSYRPYKSQLWNFAANAPMDKPDLLCLILNASRPFFKFFSNFFKSMRKKRSFLVFNI
jgi:hypothetical protein